MRLLDARTLALVDVTDDGVPPYAILSHTWGDEEITIQQLRRLGGCSQLTLSSPKTLDKKRRAIVLKKGYVKIAGAAQLAVSRGLDYLWVDTCCIDKTSSSELSEAINSMYLWYEQSAECYAFLSDVEPVVATDPDAFHESLRRSRWFTRGWTLQELIAPRLVLFYAKDWSLLGQKHSPAVFTRVISEITNIDEEVLDGRIDPLQLSVSARMAWASRRNTTRLEDAAYCLMGLFQVNMPLLYGEGRRAFTRLQEEIIQRTDDQSIFAWNSFDDGDEDPDALFGLLAQSPAQFKHAGTLQVLPPLPVYASAPSGMTNQGLRVQLYLRPCHFEDDAVMEEDYFAVLDCVKRDRDVYQCPALLLRRLSEDQYGRLRPKSQHFMPPTASTYVRDEGYRSVYIRQQPIYYHLPQFRLSPLNVESGLGSSDGVQYRLVDKFPAQNWNSATMTLKVQYSRKLQAMGIFRFQSTDKADEKVNVVVGLRRLNSMEWEGWCFQLSYRDESLEQAFREVNKRIERITSASRNSEMTSRTLRDSLGDDPSLASSATVEGIQLQGRLYISILVTLTAEILTSKEVYRASNQPVTLSKCNQLLMSASANSGVRAMTEMYHWSSNSLFRLDAYSSMTWMVQPVRSTSLSREGKFMKPIYDFMSILRQKRSGKDSNSALSVTEELAEALFIGDVSKVERILTYRTPNIETPTADSYGFAPLHWAVAGGSAKCVRLLRRKGANLKSLTKGGLSAIHVAVLCNAKVWGALAEFGDETESVRLANSRTLFFSDTALHLAAASSPDTELGTAFFKEVLDWSRDYIGLTARNTVDETPLHRAAAENNVGAIRTLFHRTYSCNVNNGDQYSRSPLWHAAAAGSRSAIEALFTLGGSVDLTDDLGRSPLHAACRGGHREVVILLLQRGARTDTETNFLNLLPMDLAAMFGFTECLKLLLDPRWRVVDQRNLDKTLQIAASFGWYECVDLLCRHGANPFVNFEYYLKPQDGYAVVVEKEADAHGAASLELQERVVDYFNTSDTCKHHRERVYPPAENKPPGVDNPAPSFSAPVGAPPPVADSAPVYLPGPGQVYAPSYGNTPSYSAPAYGNTPSYSSPGYGNTPSYSSPAYGNTPSYGNAPPPGNTPYGNTPSYGNGPPSSSPAYGNMPSYGNAPPSSSTPYGNTPSYGNHLSAPSSYAPQQGPPKYQTPGRYQSANLPARASSSAYTPMPPTQSERLQELVNPYEPYKSQGTPSQQRPSSYAYSSAPAAGTSSQESSVAGRNVSLPAYQSPRHQSSDVIARPVSPVYQASGVNSVAPLQELPKERPKSQVPSRQPNRVIDLLKSKRG
ncbi:het domain [Trichoderma arundinaceum]|uniref:Het domain n=1 Tax=Trichoderma arundinaceum TaxID=490622 RepID=A0A395NVP1_TRIAR|nr:het domain [Trichoderma arundinaceum]